MSALPQKRVLDRIYIHVESLGLLPSEGRSAVDEAVRLAGIDSGTHFNVVRMEESGTRVGLLEYRDFFDNPFPELRNSWLVDSDCESVTHRSYERSLNPPILHRKELLLPLDHPRRAEYSRLTEVSEQIGLFDDVRRIGYRSQWHHLIKERGYQLIGHELVPIGNDDADDGGIEEDDAVEQIARHRTALIRYGLSAPIQAIARHGFLDQTRSVFDYGCGRGDDVRGLQENGIAASGWDPYYAPEQPIHHAEIVNLGFVINVIEDWNERLEALTRAWSLAAEVLVVSAMLSNANTPRGQAYNDGVLTRRGTFQKYYTQAELKSFIAAALDEEPIPAGPGVFYVFRDKAIEQDFLINRYRGRSIRVAQQMQHTRPRRESVRKRTDETLYLQYQTVLEKLWGKWVSLGRDPVADEIDDVPSILEGFSSIKRALQLLARRKGLAEVQAASTTRTEDLLVFLALEQFRSRRSVRSLSPRLKRDIKAFFGTLKAAQEAAQNLLYQIADTERINKACRVASENGTGWLEEGASLQLHSSLVDQLQPVLRVYVGCASALYGDARDADLVKIHVGSGKLTLMRFDDFEGNAIPRMIERVKLKLREQDIEYFDYVNSQHEPPNLYLKSRYINEEFPYFPEQLAFDEQLQSLGFVDLARYGPSPGKFSALLAEYRWEVSGYQLQRVQTVPALDDPCGRYLTYRDLIECGDTQRRTQIPNLPKEPDSYTALLDLAINIIDPVIDYFGMIKLTYGFCSLELEKQVARGIAPKLDQHAAHERRRTGRLVCERLGAAVDFIVEDEDMGEVGNWIVNNTPFDRLYYYGPSKPIHVSHGPENSREAYKIQVSSNGRRFPSILDNQLS